APAPAPGGGAPLARLRDLPDFRVARHEVDPRGWAVVAADGRVIGEAQELLVDTARMRARYIDCDLDETALGLERVDRHVLLPVERVDLDRDDKKVRVADLVASDFAGYPVYTGLPLGGDTMSRLEAAWQRRR
ncbi:MAG: PRC-barrel domain-containing protein, partial [Longimicrobiales bacterium]